MNEHGIIQISRPETAAEWHPCQGEELTALIRNLEFSESEKENLVNETMAIMRQCANPVAPGDHNTGLIIGYVQSGKTLSFTSLSALARDNAYQIIVLLAGTTNNLVKQSYERLRKDLGVDTDRSWNWKLFTTMADNFQNSEIQRVENEILKWQRDDSSARTVMVVAMKEHTHLKKLANLFSEVDLSGVPTLIIDDEGDQAGLNTKVLQEEESTTYSRILELRKQFPHHSYLLYTATPQGPLLISRIDSLSPDFGIVLTPGENYVGGKEFFIDGSNKYVKTIPQSEVPDRDDPPTAPPKTLKDALMDFFVGVAIGLHEKEYKKGKNRSMMIHPAVTQNHHLMFARWTKQIKNDWASILDKEVNRSVECESLLAQFERSFENLRETHSINISFQDIAGLLHNAVSDTAVEEVNARDRERIPSIDWRSDYSWILVGGIALDRGFTVEGLTVSYMPRSTGVGNVDNLQQRARFFGYKRSYLGLCRIYLTPENDLAFRDYVSHEESVRESISAHIRSGKQLKDWRREWVLNSGNPARHSVIVLDMYRLRRNKRWVVAAYPYDDDEIVKENREIVTELLGKFDFTKYALDGWNDQQIIPASSDQIKTREIMPFLGQIRYKRPEDSFQHSAIMLCLEKLVSEEPDITCSVYAFSGPWSGVAGKRSLDEESRKIKNLFQGRNRQTKYPGARNILAKDKITIQIHRYDLERSGDRIIPDVPVIAVHIPDHLYKSVWVERAEDAL